MRSKSLRDEMPQTAEFIDALRDAFGKEMINEQIRAGMNGEPVFWASENGKEIGTKVECGATYRVTWDPVTGLPKGEEITK